MRVPLALRPLALLLPLAALLVLRERPAAAGDPPASSERGYTMFRPWPAALLDPAQLKAMKREGATGVLVLDVVAGGPADKAGVKKGDALVKYDGQDVPLPPGLDPKEPEAAMEAFQKAFQPIAERVKAGARVVFVVERGGKTLTLEATAIGEEEHDRLEAAAEEQRDVPSLPAISSAGPAAAGSLSFERVPEGKVRPEDCQALVGSWESFEDDAKPDNHVLRQSAPLQTEGACLVVGQGHAYADGTASVRVRMDGGGDDASGGLVVRAQGHRDFYLARVAAKDGQFRLLVVKDGRATVLASAPARDAKPGAWHTISITFAGRMLKASLDGAAPLEAADPTFSCGWTGFWTKGEAVTSFDDWKAAPSK